MLKRNIILLFAVLAIAGSVNAQIRPGIKLGYNLSGVIANHNGTTSLESNVPANPDNFHLKSGFQGGLIADCPISDAFAIQPGIRFASQGFVDKYTSNGDMVRKISLYYLQVPIYAQYRMNIAEETNLLFQAGPYLSYGLFGRQKWTKNGKSQTLSDSQKKISFGNGTASDIHNAFDYGVGAGAGIEFYRFQLMAAYEFGLYKMTFDKTDAKSAKYNVDMRNHNFSVTLAFLFGTKDPLQNSKKKKE